MNRSLLLSSLTVCLLVTGTVSAGHSNSLMDISSDGQMLAASNRDNGSVTVVDLKAGRVLHEIEVGSHPEGVTFIGDSHDLAVAVYSDDKLVIVDSKAGKVTRSIKVFDEPYAVISNAEGTRLYVSLEYPGQVLELDPAEGKVTREFDAGKFVRGLVLMPDEKSLAFTEYYTARVGMLNLESGKVVDEWVGASTDNLARQITRHPTRPKLYMPHIRSKISAAHGSGSIFPYVSVMDLREDARKRRRRFPMDSFISVRVTANPWEMAVSPDGQTLVTVFSGTDDAFVCQILDDNYREIAPIGHLRLGHNPRAVQYTPDGQTFFVVNALDFEVVGYDVKSFDEVARYRLCDNPFNEEVLRGKRLFYSALQPMASRRWISCSSCHPDGDSDGRTWQNPEGLRNTPPIFGLAWTHPLHWSADRDEVQDFEHTIRGDLMQGRGLVQGSIPDSLGKPKLGISRDLDALAAYTNSHHWTLSPHGRNGLNAAAKRGREIFESSKTRCMECHSGPFYTDSRADNKLLTHDVGTGKGDPSELMGPKYDTPTLIGVYRSAPYLHHGKAETLKDVLTTWNPEDRHGATSHLSDAEIDDLIEFLKALPFEDPDKKAREAGLPEVRR